MKYFKVTPNKNTKKCKENAEIISKIIDHEYEQMTKYQDMFNLYIQYNFYRSIGIPHENILHIYNQFFKLYKKHLKKSYDTNS